MTQIHLKEQCVKCKRLFKTLRELNQHTRMQRKPTIQILLRQHPQFFSITNVTVNEEKTLNADNDILKNKFDYMYNIKRRLLCKGKTIQKRLFKDNVKNQSSDRKATLFAQFMQDGKVKKAIKLLENSNKGSILPLIYETFEVLLEKHPKASKAPSDVLIEEEVQNVHIVIYMTVLIQRWLEMLLKRHLVLLVLRV